MEQMDLFSRELLDQGFTLLPGVIEPRACADMVPEIETALARRPEDAIESGKGGVVGGRNLIDQWQGWRAITVQSAVREFVRQHVGPAAGVVRILYFDKPPGKGWSLSMHRDRTIAVAEHHHPPSPFGKPTTKAGVPHVEASQELLERMLTLRLHLDRMHDDNGPLVVIPGSHRPPHQRAEEIRTVHCQLGDVFVMRPLLSHGSRAARADTTDHRRVVHLEIAPEETLPERYRWYRFEPLMV